MTRIGIDIMGGDYAPHTTLEGVLKAVSQLNSSTHLVLIGDEGIINKDLKVEDYPNLSIFHASEVIGMDEHPIKALQSKPNSSLAQGFGLLAQKKIDAFASAGHSGAIMVGAMHSVKLIEGIMRPCVATAFPLQDGSKNILLDVGINADCKPEVMVQFGKLGAIYAKSVFGLDKPRVALLNTGSEESKGSQLYQKAHELLKSEKDLNFVGNLEARDFYSGEADVTVCDGFTGNIVLKQTEAFYSLLEKRGVDDDYLNLFNYEQYGGTPVLGVNGNVILGHGISNGNAIANMILATERVAQANLAEHIKEAFKN